MKNRTNMTNGTEGTLRRVIYPVCKVIDEKKGTMEYIASDETLDSYREVIRASGWRFDFFAKNAPFVDSHNYCTIAQQVGKVIDFKVEGKRLVETVQWAIDVAENTLAQLGWKMAKAGYLKAVSVGFRPVKMASRWDMDRTNYMAELDKDGLAPTADNAPRCYYLEQQQLELSACILGANPNAVAKSRLQAEWKRAYKEGLLTDSDLDFISSEYQKRNTANPARRSTAAEVLARQWTRMELLEVLE